MLMGFFLFFFKFPLLLNSLTNIGDGFIVFWTDITEIKMALVIDWLNLFSQQLATLCEPKQEDVDLSSWDFFSSLYKASRQSLHSFSYLSEQARTKVLGKFNLHLDHTWMAVERQKLTHDAENSAFVHAPLSLDFFSFSLPLNVSFFLPPSPKLGISVRGNVVSS